MTPDPENSSLAMQSHLDWDPCSEVPTEVGDEVHGRYVHRFPSNWLKETYGHFAGWRRPLMIGFLP